MNQQELLDEIGDAPRVVIVGGPGTGKTTLAYKLDATGRNVRSTDELVGVLEWSELSAEVATWFTPDATWVIEGVATARALRKWLAQNPDAALDAVVVLTGRAFVELNKGQAAMHKGVATVWNEIAIDVLKRGARVINAAAPKPIGRATEAQAPERSRSGLNDK